MKNAQSDVLIIGAGAAGLAAAHKLSAAGLNVSVIEARNRIGGRILTYHDNRMNVPIELGAEFIHGKAPETFQIAEMARLTVCEASELHWLSRAGRVLLRTGSGQRFLEFQTE